MTTGTTTTTSRPCSDRFPSPHEGLFSCHGEPQTLCYSSRQQTRVCCAKPGVPARCRHAVEPARGFFPSIVWSTPCRKNQRRGFLVPTRRPTGDIRLAGDVISARIIWRRRARSLTFERATEWQLLPHDVGVPAPRPARLFLGNGTAYARDWLTFRV